MGPYEMVPVPFYDIFWQQRKHQNRSTQFRGHNRRFDVSKNKESNKHLRDAVK